MSLRLALKSLAPSSGQGPGDASPAAHAKPAVPRTRARATLATIVAQTTATHPAP